MSELDVDVERMTALEVQRDFLLRSLEDLEREHDAGDVDDSDYAALKDDYTARAAAAVRAIQAGRSRPTPSARQPRGRGLALAAGVAAFAVVAGVLVAQAAGRRDPGDVITGDATRSVTEQLNEAGRLAGEGDYEAAVAVYDEVLAEDPDQREALTYKGWMLHLAGDTPAGLDALLEAAMANPEYPDVHAFLAVVFFQNGLVGQADRELNRLDALDPPAAIRRLTDELRTRVDAALAGTTSTTAAP